MRKKKRREDNRFWSFELDSFFSCRIIMICFCDDAHRSSWSVRRNGLVHWVTINCSMMLLLVCVLWTVLPLHACSVAAPEKQCPAYPASTAGSMEESCCCGFTGQPMALWLQLGLVHQWTCAPLGRQNSWSCVGVAVSTNLLSCCSLSSIVLYREICAYMSGTPNNFKWQNFVKCVT